MGIKNYFVYFPKITCVIILVYSMLFVMDRTIFKGRIFELGSGKGFSKMKRKEWYRLITGSFFHANTFHLLCNVAAMYFVGGILENKIGSEYFLIIYLVCNIAQSVVFAKMFDKTDNSCGASPGIYGLIACILILHLINPDLFRLHLGT